MFRPTFGRGYVAGCVVVFGLVAWCKPALSQDEARTRVDLSLVSIVREGRVHAAELLLATGANVNEVDKRNGRTPLMEAVAAGRQDLCRLLIMHNADVNARERGDTWVNGLFRGYAPLHLAVRTKRLDLAKDLLEAGAGVNLKSVTGQTPLDVALDMDDGNAAMFLIEHGADPRGILDRAIVLGKGDFAAAMLRKAAESKTVGLDPDGALLTAAIVLKEDIVSRLLIEAGSNPNQSVSPGFISRLRDLDTKLPPGTFTEPYNYSTQFVLACAFAGRDTVAMLIDHKANTTVEARDGRTLMELAAENPDSGVLDLLFERGLGLGTPSATKSTALMIAANAGLLNNCKTLLKHGVDVNEATSYGNTALLAAIDGKHLDCARELLASGANPNAALSDGRTALCMAAEAGQAAEAGLLELAMDLLAHGADPSKHGPTVRPPVVSAFMAHHWDMATMLVEHGVDPNTRMPDQTTSTLLMAGIAANDASLVQALLAHGANVNARDLNGGTALSCAAYTGDATMCRALAGKGADLTMAGGVCPLQTAIQSRKFNVANLLLDLGADVNAGDSTGTTPLMTAAEAGDLALCRRLLDSGAKVNATNRLDGTALICSKDVGITRLLLERHADPNVRAHELAVYSNVVSALDIAVSDGALDRMALLYRASGRVPLGANDLISAVIGGDIRTLRERLDAGSSNEGRDSGGLTALAWASVCGNAEAVALLINRRTNVNGRDGSGRTPLMLAADAEIARSLVEHGARVNTADREGFTPFLHAVKSGRKDVVIYLAGAKANRHAWTKDDRPAISLTTDPAMLKLVNSLDDVK